MHLVKKLFLKGGHRWRQKPISEQSYGEFNFTRLARFSGLYLVKNYQKIAVKIVKEKDAVEMQFEFFCQIYWSFSSSFKYVENRE